MSYEFPTPRVIAMNLLNTGECSDVLDDFLIDCCDSSIVCLRWKGSAGLGSLVRLCPNKWFCVV